ncbi:hypothetical protein Dimus_038632 [Dionaea muscipula]
MRVGPVSDTWVCDVDRCGPREPRRDARWPAVAWQLLSPSKRDDGVELGEPENQLHGRAAGFFPGKHPASMRAVIAFLRRATRLSSPASSGSSGEQWTYMHGRAAATCPFSSSEQSALFSRRAPSSEQWGAPRG